MHHSPSRSRTPLVQSRTAKKASKGQRRMETPHPKIHALKKPTRVSAMLDKNENDAPRNEIKGVGCVYIFIYSCACVCVCV